MSDHLELLTALSNHGRWGEQDELGTLNLITPQVRADAVGLVRDGRTVSCAREVVPGLMPYAEGATAVGRRMIRSGERALADEPSGALETLEITFHGRYVTHLDSPGHVFMGRRMFNGLPAAAVTDRDGATALAVTAASAGIVTRGVLVDVPRFRGVSALPAGTTVEADEVDEVLRAQQVQVRSGDAVLLRTGHGAEVQRWRPDQPPITGYSGWGDSCLTWMHEHGVALIGADTAQDAVPPKPGAFVSPIHVIGITAMGLWLLDNCDLEALAEAAADANRWEFLFVVAPLRIQGGTGSPVNPLAIL